MKVIFERSRPWHGALRLGFGISFERNPMGTRVDDPRPWVLYKLTIEFLTRRLVITAIRYGVADASA